jgi:hypothetical protein
MHLKELFPSDLETCRNWKLQAVIMPGYSAGYSTAGRFCDLFMLAQNRNLQSGISTTTNNLNPIRVNLCPYVLGWQCRNEFKRVQNWSDDAGFLLDIQERYDKVLLTLAPTWRHYDEDDRVFELSVGLQLTETFYHLEDGGC